MCLCGIFLNSGFVQFAGLQLQSVAINLPQVVVYYLYDSSAWSL
jgi:hypothetical protein